MAAMDGMNVIGNGVTMTGIVGVGVAMATGIIGTSRGYWLGGSARAANEFLLFAWILFIISVVTNEETLDRKYTILTLMKHTKSTDVRPARLSPTAEALVRNGQLKGEQATPLGGGAQ